MAYEAICELKFNRGAPVDVLTVSDQMRQGEAVKGTFEAWLAETAARVPTAENIGHYAGIVHRFATKRLLLAETERLARMVRTSPPERVVETAAEVQRSIIRACDTGAHIELVGAGADEAFESLNPVDMEADCVHTGLTCIDSVLWGVPIGAVSLIAGRPSMGKSCLARIVGVNTAEKGDDVGYISLEERRKQFNLNLMAYRARVNITNMMRGQVTDFERERLAEARAWVKSLPLHVCYDRPLGGEQLCQRLRQMKAEHGIKMGVVDYWNRIKLPGNRHRLDEANDFVEKVTSLAGELNIALIVVCQLNRDNEKEMRPPRLSDLKESGGWEESATTVVMVHRPNFYDKSKGSETETELYVRKQKTGRVGKVVGYWEGKYLSIRDDPPRGQSELDL